MGLATIDPHSQKEHTETKSLSLVLIRLVLTQIQEFVKKLQTNIWKCGQIRTFVRICLLELKFYQATSRKIGSRGYIINADRKFIWDTVKSAIF